MANNCLQTKLKSVVENSSLEKLGILNIELYDSGSLMFSQAQDVKLLNGIFNSTGNNVINISSDSRFYFTSDYCTLNSGETTYKVEVPKYHLTSVRRIVSKETIDIDWLYKWSDSDYYEVYVLNHETQLSHLNDYTDKFGGEFVATGASVTPTEVWDVTHLGESRLLTRLYISSLSIGWITGSFDNLGNSPLTEIIFPGGLSKCSFNIENFVRKNVAAGRTTYSIQDLSYLASVNTTFKGALLTDDLNIEFNISWSPNATAGKTDIVITNKNTGTSDNETINNVV